MRQHLRITVTGLFALILVQFTANTARADTAMECSFKASSQIEIRDCVTAELKVVDRALVQALGYARNAATALDAVTGRNVAVPALEMSQARWKDYRDTHCKYIAALFAGGSGTGIAEGSCRVASARQRIAELKAATQ